MRALMRLEIICMYTPAHCTCSPFIDHSNDRVHPMHNKLTINQDTKIDEVGSIDLISQLPIEIII